MSRSKPNPRRPGEPAARDWKAARAKVEREGRCRRCFSPHGLEAAHVIPRSRVRPGAGEDPLNIIPLCEGCHRLEHAGHIELGAYLTVAEWEHAVGLVGAGEAQVRLFGREAV